jgi:hypothetical protein
MNKCFKCKEDLYGGLGVNGKKNHTKCFLCEKCSKILKEGHWSFLSKFFFKKDDQYYCDDCKEIQKKSTSEEDEKKKEEKKKKEESKNGKTK